MNRTENFARESQFAPSTTAISIMFIVGAIAVLVAWATPHSGEEAMVSIHTVADQAEVDAGAPDPDDPPNARY